MSGGDSLEGALLTDTSGQRFELLRALGAGAFGEVFLARVSTSGGLDQLVAVKLLKADLHPGTQATARLRDEGRLLAGLRHPVILAVRDLVSLDGRTGLVTEFVEGEDLTACITGPDRMPPETVVEVVEQIASALELAWRELGVVHRDIKPHNIRVGRHGNVKLLDFGIARTDMIPRAARTASEMLVGTVRYLAPERFDLRRPVEPASDVFALGCVLFEGVAGEPFYEGLGFPEICRLAIEHDTLSERTAERLQHIPSPEIRALVARMLRPDPTDRPTAGEVAQQCEAIAAAAPERVSLRRWCRERGWETVSVPASIPPPPPPEGAVETTWAERPKTLDAPPSGASGPRIRTMGSETTADSLSGPVPTDTTEGSLQGPPPPSLPSPPRRWLRWGALSLVVPAGLGAVGFALAATAAALALAAALYAGLVYSPSEPLPELPVEPEQPVPEQPAPEQPEPTAPEPPRDAAPRRGSPSAEPPKNTPAAPERPEPDAAPARTYEIAFSSIPLGAEIRLVETDRLLGIAPFTVALPAGRYTARIRGPDGQDHDHLLQVGRNTPTRYVWRADGDRWESHVR